MRLLTTDLVTHGLTAGVPTADYNDTSNSTEVCVTDFQDFSLPISGYYWSGMDLYDTMTLLR